jgi:DNA-binding transcriptional ArsR family regulator
MSADLETPAPAAAPKRARKPKPPDGKKIQQTATLLKHAADPTRLRVLLILAEKGEVHVKALCTQIDQSVPAVSHHLAALKFSGVLNWRREGKTVFYSLGPPGKSLIRAARGLMDDHSDGT